ncbi:MAG: AbgT family transporter [Xanthomonadales bacterium]|jgi:aminobenzoyl-glutamate transport protein|nr:AbgT family transporter [Xanthomonadales bacterium]
MTDTTLQRSGAVDRFLNVVERAGNALPHPATLFAVMALLVLVASAIAAAMGMAVVHPSTGAEVKVVNLLSQEGIHRIMTGLVTNFTSFAPLGTVLVALIGIGVAEVSGLIGAAMRLLVLSAPARLLTPIVVFAGILSNMASEIGYVLLVPLAGLIFLAAGRHPLVGVAAAFAGVSGGYSANLMLGTIDPLLSGLTQEAARLVEPGYTVSPMASYYFMFVSTFMITALGTWVTEKIVAPRVGDWKGERKAEDAIQAITAAEKRGLKFALIAMLVLSAVVIWGLAPEDGFLRKIGATGSDSLLQSPFLVGIVSFIFAAGLIMGVAYGIGAGTVKSDEDVIKGMSQQMSTLGSYMVLVFFAAQFVAFFNWSNLGLVMAVNGAEFLKAVGLPKIPLFLAFILLTAVVNLAMGSASAKWALMAPIFVPMFMLLGYPPETTVTAYRVGDSVTNIISPMMSYFALIIAFIQRYEPKAGIGTVVALMIPYSITFLIGWSLLFVAWVLLGWPMGPGSPVLLPVGG